MQLYSSSYTNWWDAAETTLDPHFDRKLEVVTAGLAREFCRLIARQNNKRRRFNSYGLYDIIKRRKGN